MATTGIVFQLIGFVITGFALRKRAKDHGAPPGWILRNARRLKWWFKRVVCRRPPRVVCGEASIHIGSKVEARGRVRPGALPACSSTKEVEAWATRYFQRIDEELTELQQSMVKGLGDLRATQDHSEAKLDQEIRTVHHRINSAMTGDLGLAWFGLLVAVVGTFLALLAELGV